MQRRLARYGGLGLLSLIGAILICFVTAAPSQAHWADMAAAEIVVGERETQMTLTFPTGLAAFADTDQNGQLAASEVQQHYDQLQAFLAAHIQFTSASNQADLRIEPVERGAVPLTGQAAPNTHSTLKLIYAWLQPVQGLTLRYNLFLPGVPTASCLATILQADQLKTHVFTPQKPTLGLTSGLPGFMAGGLGLALVGAFGWGAIHSLSPGHGKTIVAAYLVGGRATAQHALFLAATTTITHTMGVFALGFATLFAAKYIVPEQLYRWLSLISGLMIAAIGVRLLQSRLKLASTHHHAHSLNYSDHADGHTHFHSQNLVHSHDPQPPEFEIASVESSVNSEVVEPSQASHPDHSHHHSVIDANDHYSHDHTCIKSHGHHHDCHTHHHDSLGHGLHPYGHHHSHHHSHHHEHHSHHHHLPPGTDGAPVTWQSLLALGISGGLIPCPAALVLLLGCIALGNIGLGLLLVLAFSLGLAGVLTGMGLALVYAKQVFQFLPSQIRPIRFLPILSAVVIAVIGLSISTRAFMQVVSST